MITPSYAPHAKLEAEAVRYFEQHGFSVHQQTYHESFPADVVQSLKGNSSISSLYIRSRADRVAISPATQFEFEVKTHFNDRYNDLTVEALPFLMHFSKRNFINCLYVCNVNHRNFGFWVSDPPKPKLIGVPDVPKNLSVRRLIMSSFHDVPFNNRPSSGSNDPYMIIGENEIKKLNDWKNIFREPPVALEEQINVENDRYLEWLT